MTRITPNWKNLWPFILLWGAAPAPLYIWLIISLLMRQQ